MIIIYSLEDSKRFVVQNDENKHFLYTRSPWSDFLKYSSIFKELHQIQSLDLSEITWVFRETFLLSIKQGKWKKLIEFDNIEDLVKLKEIYPELLV